jgi:hypothetical protein
LFSIGGRPVNGEFNYDGKINVVDYGIIDFNVGIQGAPFPTGTSPLDGAASLSGAFAVPEPATGLLTLAGITCGLTFRRGRRRT